MTQTMYAHVNKQIKINLKKKTKTGKKEEKGTQKK
jgi:hypothetical protein